MVARKAMESFMVVVIVSNDCLCAGLKDNEPEVMAVMQRSKCAVLPAFGHFNLFFCHFAMRGGFWMFLFSEVSINSTVGKISLLRKFRSIAELNPSQAAFAGILSSQGPKTSCCFHVVEVVVGLDGLLS